MEERRRKIAGFQCDLLKYECDVHGKSRTSNEKLSHERERYEKVFAKRRMGLDGGERKVGELQQTDVGSVPSTQSIDSEFCDMVRSINFCLDSSLS
ncbi:unnamed protein product, partial [Ceratitis capitata]